MEIPNQPRNTGTPSGGQTGTPSGGMTSVPTPTLNTAPVVSQQTWNPPKRWYRDQNTGEWKYGNVDGIVNGRTGQVGNYYDIDVSPYQIWYSMTPAKRNLVIDSLQSRGFNMKTFTQQINGFQQVIVSANALGQDWETVLTRMGTLKTGQPTGGPTYRVSNPADIKAVADQVFRATLGRGATGDEADRFVKFYQQEQVKGQQGSVAAPQADVAAQQFAQLSAPREEAAYKMLGLLGTFADFVKTGGM